MPYLNFNILLLQSHLLLSPCVSAGKTLLKQIFSQVSLSAMRCLNYSHYQQPQRSLNSYLTLIIFPLFHLLFLLPAPLPNPHTSPHAHSVLALQAKLFHCLQNPKISVLKKVRVYNLLWVGFPDLNHLIEFWLESLESIHQFVCQLV